MDAWIHTLTRDIQVSSQGHPGIPGRSLERPEEETNQQPRVPAALFICKRSQFSSSSSSSYSSSFFSFSSYHSSTSFFSSFSSSCPQAEMSSEDTVTKHSARRDATVTSQQRVAGSSAHTGRGRPVSALRRTGSKTAVGRGSRGRTAGQRLVRVGSIDCCDQ